MANIHRYRCALTWTGNSGQGTSSYRAYERSYFITIEGKPTLEGSADAAFRGDASRHNPEDLFLASIASCHMLWYLHLAADAGIAVVAYIDRPEGTMEEDANGGRFTGVHLTPQVSITAHGLSGATEERARALHREAHAKCFIANSVNMPITCMPTITTVTA
ncbi:MAG: OsmC family protein [Pseudomonadota bacterium]